MQVERQFIGLDLGTTTFKGAVLDLDGSAVGPVVRVPAPSRVSHLAATRHELDPEAVLTSVRSLLDELVRRAPGAAGLVMCSQMHSVVLTDERGRPRSNVITWKDQRAAELLPSSPDRLFDRLRRQVSTDQQSAIGGELRVGVPIGSLAALRREDSLPDDVYAASLPDFVLANLLGTAPTTEPTNAAASGLYHLDKRDWHRELITALGLDGLRWPVMQPFRDRVGEIQVKGRMLACFTPVGDQQCALAGGGLRERELSLNISTGSQASLLGRDRPRGDFLARPYFDGLWLRTIVSVPAGRALQVLVDLLTEIGGRTPDPWDFIQNAVNTVDDTDLVVDLSLFPSLTGERGGIANIHEGNLTVGHLFAAAFRTMAANYARCAGVLSPDRDWDRVVFSGGLAQRFARLRRDILTALAQPPARLCSTEEDTLRGLLVLALVCDGRAATVEEATRLLAPSE